MPIVVPCGTCRKQYQVGDQFAGKTVKCPGCKQPLAVPAAQAAAQPASSLADLFDDEMPVHHAAYGEAETRCPNCNLPVKPETILCVDCGYDFRKRKKIVPDTPGERQARFEAREAKMRGQAPGAKGKKK
ncbi:MAG: hypothetical protein ACYC6Y_13780 [Thermoguttaceae bacterium]